MILFPIFKYIIHFTNLKSQFSHLKSILFLNLSLNLNTYYFIHNTLYITTTTFYNSKISILISNIYYIHLTILTESNNHLCISIIRNTYLESVFHLICRGIKPSKLYEVRCGCDGRKRPKTRKAWNSS